jgi:hypothetical protein
MQMNSVCISNVDVSVNVKDGRPMRLHNHEGRLYIESRDGTEYSIEIKNNNWYRVEVVASVDGLGVINGKPASKTDSGYVVPAWGKLSIKGYRKDDAEVGAFKFTSKAASYAKEKGAEENVGVIAIAVYSEKIVYPSITTSNHLATSEPMWYDTCSNDSYSGILRGISDVQSYTCSSMSVSDESVGQSHGTTWGEAIKDAVVTVEFERNLLLFQSEIFYDSRESLIARGIKLVTEKLMVRPRGFPSDYASPPVGWNG